MPRKGEQLSELDYFPADVAGLGFDRAAFFKKLRIELKKRTASQNPKLKYALLCKGMTPADVVQMTSNICSPFDNKLSWVDYAFIYEIDAKSESGAPLIWMECPLMFTPKSLNTFVYFYEKKREDEFFKDYIRGSITFPAFVIQAALTKAGLELMNERADNYWKKPENSQKVLSVILNMAEQYKKRNY